MAVLRDYYCSNHGIFEGWDAKCPIKHCNGEISIVHLKPVALKSDKTKNIDKTRDGLAADFGMTDIKTVKEGESQSGYLKKDNKLTDKQYQLALDAEAEIGRQRANEMEKAGINPEIPAAKEARAGDNAIWGGGFQGLNMQSILAGRAVQSIKGESVGFNPKDAGNLTGPKAASYIADQDNLQVKTE